MIFELEEARKAAKAEKLGEKIPLAAEYLLGTEALAHHVSYALISCPGQ